MRPAAALLLVLAAASLAGCQPFYAAAGTATGFNVLALTTIGRTIPDAVVSLIRNRDCSAVRLEQGRSYCEPSDAVPELPAFCTHSLGTADCWANPALLPGGPLALADTPPTTAAQLAHAAHHWPDAW